jgi:hypothetical protein
MVGIPKHSHNVCLEGDFSMRTYRAILAALVAALMVVGLSVATAQASSKPSRVIEEQQAVQVRALSARIKGNVTQPVFDATGAIIGYDRYVNKVVKIHRKQCGKCRWKIYKKIKTNKYGTYRYFAQVPRKGLWKYRATVPASQGYAKTRSKPQGIWLG